MATTDRLTIMRRWTARGAFFGVEATALDLTGWRGPTYLPLDVPVEATRHADAVLA